jgi:hypothetical protein
MITIEGADIFKIDYVARHLRDLDRAELEAAGSEINRLKYTIMRNRVFAFCAKDLSGPIAVWGMLRWRPGVGAGFAFGTDRWGRALLPMVNHIRKFVLPFLRKSRDFHRVEALALAHRQDVARFMELIDARPEGLLRGYGCNGEDFISYRWLADEHRGERRNAGALHAHTAH